MTSNHPGCNGAMHQPGCGHPGSPKSEHSGGTGLLTAESFHPNPVVSDAIARAKATGQSVLIETGDPSGGDFDPGVNVSTAGDYSLAAEPSMRFTWATGRDDEPFVSITDTYYVVARRDGDDRDLTVDEHDEAVVERERAVGSYPETVEEFPPIRYAVENQTEFIVHSDFDDPGMSEIRSDYEHDSGSAMYYSSLEEAENVATRLARYCDPSHYGPQNV